MSTNINRWRQNAINSSGKEDSKCIQIFSHNLEEKLLDSINKKHKQKQNKWGKMKGK